MGMQVETHARLELIDAEPGRLRAALGDGLHEMIGRRLDEAPVTQGHAVDRLDAVRLDGDDTGDASGVVDLASDLLVLDELPDGDHSFGRRDECVVRLASAALRLLFEA